MEELDKKMWRNWSAEFYIVQAMAVSSTSRYPLVIEPLAGKFPIKYGSFIAGKIIENHGECSIATFDERMVFLGSYGGGPTIPTFGENHEEDPFSGS